MNEQTGCERYGGPWQESRAYIATVLIGLAAKIHFRATLDTAADLTDFTRAVQQEKSVMKV